MKIIDSLLVKVLGTILNQVDVKMVERDCGQECAFMCDCGCDLINRSDFSFTRRQKQKKTIPPLDVTKQ